MSRNFDTMTQIESEIGATPDQVRAASDRVVVGTGSSRPVGNIGGEAMSRLVQSIFLSTDGSAPRQVVFCGVDSEKGSSAVCANVGKTLAASNAGSVCFVDANLSAQLLAGLFGVDKMIVPRRATSLREQCLKVGDNLWLVGRDFLADDRGALPAVATIKQLLEELRGAFDFVLIAAPGPDVSGDTAILGQVSDETVLVIEAGTTRRLAARKAKQTLEAASVRILGTVLNNRSFPIPKGLYERL
jgi:Mrp family chromosome partitioning ATPase